MLPDYRTALSLFRLLFSSILVGWTSGVFNAEIHPDLPPARTVAELLRCYFVRAKEAVIEAKEHDRTSRRAGTSTPPGETGSQLAKDAEGGDGYLVRTVPVQMSRNEVRDEWLFARSPRKTICMDLNAPALASQVRWGGARKGQELQPHQEIEKQERGD